MSLKPERINPVPEETARIAHAAYPKGNIFMHMRDELGTMYENESFADLFSHTGQPAEVPWRLALVTIMQFAEGLSDRQAADAVRGRSDWKYALGLELDDAGFDASILSEFSTRLVEGQAEERLLTVMLTMFKECGWLKAQGKQRTLRDVPCGGRKVILRLAVRKFFCRNSDCARKIFTERLPPFVEPWAQVTTRLFEAVQAIGLAYQWGTGNQTG